MCLLNFFFFQLPLAKLRFQAIIIKQISSVFASILIFYISHQVMTQYSPITVQHIHFNANIKHIG